MNTVGLKTNLNRHKNTFACKKITKTTNQSIRRLVFYLER